MAGYQELAALLMGREDSLLPKNPYYAAGAGVLKNQADYGSFQDPWQALAAGLGGGLIGGGLAGYGKSQVQDQLTERRSKLQELLSGGDLSALANDKELAPLALAQSLEQRDTQRKLNQERAKEKRDLEGKITLKQTPDSPLDFAMDSPGKPVESGPLSRLGPSYEEQLNTAVKEASRMGLSPTGKLEYARLRTKPSEIDTKNTEETLNTLRDSTAALDLVISTAKAGVQGAGETGGGALYAVPRNILSKAVAPFNQDQQNKQTAQTTLDSIKDKLIIAARAKGVGAMSDPEMRIYLGTGPNSGNTPDANLALIGKFEAVASLNKEYMNFLEYVQAKQGTTKGANKLWNEYKAENPLFLESPDGQFVPNTSRPPVMDWLQGTTGATQPEAQGSLPPIQTLMSQFPPTSEGKAAFLQKAREMGYQ